MGAFEAEDNAGEFFVACIIVAFCWQKTSRVEVYGMEAIFVLLHDNYAQCILARCVGLMILNCLVQSNVRRTRTGYVMHAFFSASSLSAQDHWCDFLVRTLSGRAVWENRRMNVQ